MAALEFDYPLGRDEEESRQLLLHWHAAYTVFGNDVVFSGRPSIDTGIRDQWELGLALGRRDSPIRVGFLNFDRLGLGFRSSSDGDLKGITFIFRSLFDQ
jgi:hypothetical protein